MSTNRRGWSPESNTNASVEPWNQGSRDMNTNETIEYEIPTEEELDVSVQTAERRGICIGIKAMLGRARYAVECVDPDWPSVSKNIAIRIESIMDTEARKLIAEQGEK